MCLRHRAICTREIWWWRAVCRKLPDFRSGPCNAHTRNQPSYQTCNFRIALSTIRWSRSSRTTSTQKTWSIRDSRPWGESHRLRRRRQKLTGTKWRDTRSFISKAKRSQRLGHCSIATVRISWTHSVKRLTSRRIPPPNKTCKYLSRREISWVR